MLLQRNHDFIKSLLVGDLVPPYRLQCKSPSCWENDSPICLCNKYRRGPLLGFPPQSGPINRKRHSILTILMNGNATPFWVNCCVFVYGGADMVPWTWLILFTVWRSSWLSGLSFSSAAALSLSVNECVPKTVGSRPPCHKRNARRRRGNLLPFG